MPNRIYGGYLPIPSRFIVVNGIFMITKIKRKGGDIMKRILIATTVLFLMTACVNEKDDSVNEKETTEEDESIEADTSYNYEELKRNYEYTYDSYYNKGDEFSIIDDGYMERDPFISETIDGVIINVHGVGMSRTHPRDIKVYYSVENVSTDVKAVPLMDSVLVTSDGDQLRVDKEGSNPPEWLLYPSAKDVGYVKFMPEEGVLIGDDIVPSIYFKGVDFKEENDRNFSTK